MSVTCGFRGVRIYCAYVAAALCGTLVVRRRNPSWATWRSRLFDGIVACRSCLHLSPRENLMANYFYTDANGTKQGPLTTQQLQALATQGIIVPTTPLETCDGHQEIAGQVPGLFDSSTTRMKTRPSWRFVFPIHKLDCLVCCILAWIGGIFVGLAVTYWGVHVLVEAENLPGTLAVSVRFTAVVSIVGAWWCCAIGIVFTRVICTWSLITSQAAQLYVENCKKK